MLARIARSAVWALVFGVAVVVALMVWLLPPGAAVFASWAWRSLVADGPLLAAGAGGFFAVSTGRLDDWPGRRARATFGLGSAVALGLWLLTPTTSSSFGRALGVFLWRGLALRFVVPALAMVISVAPVRRLRTTRAKLLYRGACAVAAVVALFLPDGDPNNRVVVALGWTLSAFFSFVALPTVVIRIWIGGLRRLKRQQALEALMVVMIVGALECVQNWWVARCEGCRHCCSPPATPGLCPGVRLSALSLRHPTRRWHPRRFLLGGLFYIEPRLLVLHGVMHALRCLLVTSLPCFAFATKDMLPRGRLRALMPPAGYLFAWWLYIVAAGALVGTRSSARFRALVGGKGGTTVHVWCACARTCATGPGSGRTAALHARSTASVLTKHRRGGRVGCSGVPACSLQVENFLRLLPEQECEHCRGRAGGSGREGGRGGRGGREGGRVEGSGHRGRGRGRASDEWGQVPEPGLRSTTGCNRVVVVRGAGSARGEPGATGPRTDVRPQSKVVCRPAF